MVAHSDPKCKIDPDINIKKHVVIAYDERVLQILLKSRMHVVVSRVAACPVALLW